MSTPVSSLSFGGGYRYNASWKADPRLEWVTKGRSSDEVYCGYCQCYINIRKEGINILLSHGDLESHQFIMNYKKDGRIAGRDAPKAVKADLTQRAEILWCIQVASAGYPYYTSNISDLFAAMFVDSKIAKNIVVGRSKLKYEINKGLYPYMLRELVKPILECDLMYVLHYEESITEAGKRTLDIYIRYWHDASGRIANVLIASHGIKRFDSEFCLHKCIEALDRYNLPLSRLVYVSSHSPDKDQIVYRSINAHVCDSGGLPMVETITFNENVVYGAYGKLLNVLGEWGMEDLVCDLRAWFSTCNEPDPPFTSLTEVFGNDELGYSSERISNSGNAKTTYRINNALLYRHTLGLAKTFGHVIANWPCLVKYFSSYVPNSLRGVKRIPRYLRLHAAITNNITLLRLTFLRGVGQTLDQFLDSSLFLEGPHIQCLNSAVSRLVKDIGARFLRAEVRADVVTGLSHVKYEELDQQLPNDRLNIGAPPGTIFREVSALKLGAFYSDVRSGYSVLFGYLITRLPITDPVVRGARALAPELRQEKRYSSAIQQLVKCLPQLVPPTVIEKVLEEWDEYQTMEMEEMQDNEAVEEYWDRVFKLTRLGNIPKFRHLSKLIQVLLCMYYRPSTNGKILRHVEHRHTNKVAQEFIDLQYNGMVSQTVINDSLVEAYRVGWDKYSQHYQQKDLLRQASDAVDFRLSSFGDVTKAGFYSMKEAEFLVSEGIRKIDHGITNGNMLEINGGVAMVEEARIKIRSARIKLTHRLYLRDLDEKNRLLSIGVYRIKQGMEKNDEDAMRLGLDVIYRGLEGITDIRMELRPDSAFPHTRYVEVEVEGEPDNSCCN